MLLITVLLSLLLLRIWGSGKRLQQDHWYFSLVNYFSQVDSITRFRCGAIVAALITCLIAVYVLHSVLFAISGWLAVLLSAVILIFAMGRGELEEVTRRYIAAWRDKNWQAASASAQTLAIDTYEIDPDDWVELNHRLVSAIAYRGFESLFVVLFWFCLGGVLPALAYRLISLSRQESERPEEAEQLAQVLWLLEWPAVRVFGLSLAITGNFSSCFARIQRFLLDTSKSTQKMLVLYVESALSVEPVESDDPRCGERELREILRLYNRTKVLWVCAIALLTLFT